jgi:hypothetical protein
VREIRDDIEQRVRTLVEERADEIRADRTGHARRLAQLLSNLASEFEGVRTGEEIRACAETTLDKYADVPVRSFVLTLAEREARDCLRADRCSPSPRNAITTPGKAGRRVSFAASTASNHGGQSVVLERDSVVLVANRPQSVGEGLGRPARRQKTGQPCRFRLHRLSGSHPGGRRFESG